MDKSEFQKKLGKQIALLRKERNLSQVDLADLLDKEKQNINRLENGGTNPTSYFLYQLAQKLNVPITSLFEHLLKEPESKKKIK